MTSKAFQTAHRALAAMALTVAVWMPLTAIHASPDTMEAARQLQNAFTTVAEQASPAVVVITNKQVVRRPQRGLPQLPPEFRFFFNLPEAPEDSERPPQAPTPAGRGSGVIFRADGFIVTNHHVIRNHDALEVKLHDNRIFSTDDPEYPVEVVGVDEETDLAVLRIGGGHVMDLPTLAFAPADSVRVGQWAIAVGAPFNFDYSVTVGVVSQKGRYDMRMNTYENYLQTDASINPGNSGGPLLNLDGEIIGINNFIVTGGGFSRGNVGIGFAIASSLAQQVVEQIVESGQVIRPWLGIAMQELTRPLKQQFGVTHGVLISDVMEGDPAEAAGLRAGDVILKVGEREVNTPRDVQFAVLQYSPGERIEMVINRDGERKTMSVQPRRKDLAADAGDMPDEDLLNELGLQLDEVEDGVRVRAVTGGGRAAAADLRPGDVVLEVNRRSVETIADVLDALNATRDNVAVLYIERQGRKFFVTVALN